MTKSSDKVLNESQLKQKLSINEQLISQTKQLNSFKELKLKLVIKKEAKAKQSLILNLISIDLIILLLLNIIFAIYLFKFINYYFYDEKNAIDIKSDFNQLYLYMVSLWFKFNKFDVITKEECALPIPELLNSILRPISDCKMCDDLLEIPIVETISKKEFLDKYAYTGVPLLVKNGASNWTAINTFSFEFFKELYSNTYQNKDEKFKRKKFKKKSRKQSFIELIKDNSHDSQLYEEKDTCQFFGYKTNFKSLNQVFRMNDEMFKIKSKNFKPWYIGWSNCNKYATKVLRQHYSRPYFLPDESEMSKTDWIFMGNLSVFKGFKT